MRVTWCAHFEAPIAFETRSLVLVSVAYHHKGASTQKLISKYNVYYNIIILLSIALLYYHHKMYIVATTGVIHFT